MLVLVLEQLDLHFLLPRSLEFALPELVCRARNGHTTLAAHEPLEQTLLAIVRRCGLLGCLHDARDPSPHVDSAGAIRALRAVELRRTDAGESTCRYHRAP